MFTLPSTCTACYAISTQHYDVAIAQAIAITYQSCTNRNEDGAYLQLTAGNQSQINMGRFYISCALAYDLVSAYGLSDEITRPVHSPSGRQDMPSLNLNTDAKAQRFVNFSTNFKPVER